MREWWRNVRLGFKRIAGVYRAGELLRLPRTDKRARDAADYLTRLLGPDAVARITGRPEG